MSEPQQLIAEVLSGRYPGLGFTACEGMVVWRDGPSLTAAADALEVSGIHPIRSNPMHVPSAGEVTVLGRMIRFPTAVSAAARLVCAGLADDLAESLGRLLDAGLPVDGMYPVGMDEQVCSTLLSDRAAYPTMLCPGSGDAVAHILANLVDSFGGPAELRLVTVALTRAA